MSRIDAFAFVGFVSLAVTPCALAQPSNGETMAPADRVVWESEPIELTDRRAAALDACGYNESLGEWGCSKAALERFAVVRRLRIEGPQELKVRVRLLADADKKCVSHFGVTLVPSASLVVDWTHSTFTVRGRARQVVPGFMRFIHSDQGLRPSVAAAGATLTETVAADADEHGVPCLLPEDLRGVVDIPATADVALRLAVQVDGRDDEVEIVATDRFVAADERAAFAFVEPPGVIGSDPGPEPSGSLLTGVLATVGGTAVCFGLCMGCFAYSDFDRNLREGLPRSLALSGVGAAPALVVGTGVTAFNVLFVDSEKREAWEARRVELAESAARDEARLKAFFKKRTSLGLEASQAH